MRSLLRIVLPIALFGPVVACLALAFFWPALVDHLDSERQKTHGGLAEAIVALDEPSILGPTGELNPRHAADVVAWLEATSPGQDFYILDLRGRIIAPDPEAHGLEVDWISMPPLRRFMDRRRIHGEGDLILAPDPREDVESPAAEKPFSIALLPGRGEPQGYLYIVLHNPLHEAAAPALLGAHFRRLTLWTLAALVLGTAAAILFLRHRVDRPLARLRGKLAFQLEQKSQTADSDGATPEATIRNSTISTARLSDPAAPDAAISARELRNPEAAQDPISALDEDIDRLLSRLEAQEKEIASLARVRREVLANFTHDLRTPIATMRGYLETLALGSHALTLRKRQDYLEIALRHSERLSRLVDELLELSRLDRCEVAPRLERFRLGELVQDNLQRFLWRAEEKKIRLEADFDPDLPPVFADVSLMERALENLIGNALRHCQAGDRICVRLRPDGHRLLVSVIDSGSGIAADDLPHIFDRFYRASQEQRAIEHRGAGLGLAITHRIAALHGGKLEVESQLGEGSTFTFSLEIAPLTFQLSTADQLRLKPSRWPPRFTSGPSSDPTQTAPVQRATAQTVTNRTMPVRPTPRRAAPLRKPAPRVETGPIG